MVTQREYLAGLGLAKPGTRGRFSLAAKAEIARAIADGMSFSDTKRESKNVDDPDGLLPDESPIVFPPLPDRPKLRSIDRVIGYTKQGDRVAQAECLRCAYHVNYCSCLGGITLSGIISSVDDASKEYCQPVADSVLV